MMLPPGLSLSATSALPLDTIRPGDATFWAEAGEWASDTAAGADAQDVASGRVLAGLGRVYLDHADPARALVLGLAAMAMGDSSPAVVLLVAAAFIQAGDPEQAMAALSRLNDDGPVSQSMELAELAARNWLMARILLLQGRLPEARAALEQAQIAAGRADLPRNGAAE